MEQRDHSGADPQARAEKMASLTAQDEKVSSLNRHFINWLGWKLALPLLLIASLYILIGFIMEIPEPFGRAFSHGDLMVFSALVLLEAATEGEHNHAQSAAMDVARTAAKISAIIFIMGFVATKYDILSKEYHLFAQLTTQLASQIANSDLRDALSASLEPGHHALT